MRIWVHLAHVLVVSRLPSPNTSDIGTNQAEYRRNYPDYESCIGVNQAESGLEAVSAAEHVGGNQPEYQSI
eukprot:2576266-Rhodomonas_salina.1